MKKNELDKKAIEALLPHREPMLLIDKLTNIVHLKSATAIMYVKKNGFYVQGHFPDQPVMPGVLIVEAFGQAAAALTAHGIDRKEYANKLVFYNVQSDSAHSQFLKYSNLLACKIITLHPNFHSGSGQSIQI